jgi:hypothetical protein
MTQERSKRERKKQRSEIALCQITLAGSDQVEMKRSIALPQLVDVSDVKCNYQDGLLRIEIPIQAPRLEEEDQTRIATLEEEAKEAAKHVTELERKLRECKSKAHAAQSALRSAQLHVHTRRHTLAIA